MVTGVVPPGPSGMRDYGDLLAAELVRRGASCERRWVDNDTLDLPMTVRTTRDVLALAWHLPRGTDVVWNYAPTPIGYRGVPGPGVLFGLVLRLRGNAPLTVLHELAQRWSEQSWTTRARAVAQVLLLSLVVAGSREVVVTTPQRLRRLRPFLGALRTPLRFAPVFSNFEAPRPLPEPLSAPSPEGGFTIVVLDHGADFARPAVVIDALQRLRADGPASMVLLGSPGPTSEPAARWRTLAERSGVEDAVSWSGILTHEEFSQTLLGADAILLPNGQGPSCRKGTLAAAVSHGRPVVSIDGPMRWQPLVDAGAVEVTEASGPALAAALAHLRSDPEARRVAGARAARFYDEAMSVGETADVVAALLAARSDGSRPAS